MSQRPQSLVHRVSARLGSRAQVAAMRRELELAERRYRQLVETIPAVVYEAEFDPEATLHYISPQIEQLVGHPAQAFLDDQELWYRSIHPDDVERVRSLERSTQAEDREFECEYRMVTRDGRVVHVWECDQVVRDPAGTPLFTQGILVDVTPLRETQDELRAQRDQVQTYLDAASDMFLVLNPSGKVAMLNRAGHEALGYEDGTLIGADWFDVALPEAERDRQREGFREVMSGARSAPFQTYENTLATRGGDVLTVVWRSTVTRDESGAPTSLLASGIDVSQRRAAERQVSYLDYHDSVTGLPNRALLEQHLGLALARARRRGAAVAMLCLDLDDFRLVNDSLGHAHGDDLLRLIAERLRERTRATDLLVRTGADEFMLLLADLELHADPEEQARSAAVALLGALKEPFTIAGTEFDIGASVGISLFPGDASGTHELLSHANRAVHEVKAGRRGGIARFERTDAVPIDRLSLSHRLGKAIDADELVLHWQPIVDPTTGELRRAEALVRWQDPQRGLVPPGEFIGFAESSGLIDRLGAWVAENAIRQAAEWASYGLEVEVAFNVSARELRRPDYAARLRERLDRHRLPADRVVVEVTESAAMPQDGSGDTILRELADASLRVAIDDFGAGWSSLGRLRELPVQGLKIDRSFLRGVPEDPEAAAVVRAILELAAALGMETVAEGVETAEQRRFLIDRDCPLAQGYLLNRPMTSDALEALLRGASPGDARRAAA